MGVRVYDKTAQQVVEAQPEEAQQAFLEGGAALAQDQIRVKREGNRTGTVSAADLPAALAEGWEVSDDEERRQITLRREESDLLSSVQGGAEAIGSGLSLGGTTWLLDAVGVDSERMAARRGELGGFGDALEIAGAVAPALLTGGGSAAVQGGARAARGLASTIIRNTPAGLVARGGARLEGAIATRLGTEAGTLTRLVPTGARNFVEGTAQGIGAEVDEAVLGDRELVADQILSQGLYSGLLGTGIGAAVPGLAAIANGAMKAPVKGMQRVLGRMNSASGGTASREASSSLADLGSTAWQASARMAGVDATVAQRLGHLGSTREGRGVINDVLQRHGQIQEDAVELVGNRLNKVNEDLTNVRLQATGSAKARQFDRLVPESAEHVAPRAADDLYVQTRSHLQEMIDENRLNPYGAAIYDAPMLKEADGIMRRLEANLVEAEQLAGRSRASRKAIALDQAKRELGTVIDNSGGWGRPKFGIAPTVSSTNAKLRNLYDGIRENLEREDLWGGAAVAQKEINAAYRAEAQAMDVFGMEAKGSAISKIFNADGSVNARQALAIVRQFGKVGGDATMTRLDDVLSARLNYLKTVSKHYDLDDAARQSIRDVEASVRDLRGAFQSQSKLAAVADDLEVARIAEGNRSPSIGLLSSVGPTVLGLAGFGLGGAVGAAGGILAGAVTRPFSSLKTFAGVMEIVDRADLGVAQAVGRIGKRIATAASGARPSSGGLGRAATVGVARTRKESDERRDRAIANAAHLASSPEAIDRALDVPLYDLQRVAPGVASLVANRVQTAADFLRSKAPKVYQSPFSTKPPLVDPISAASFERYLSTVQDPIGTLNEIADGSVTREQAEALRIVYPALYKDVQDQITDTLADAADRGHEVPFDLRIKLGIMFTVPIDPSLTPQAQLAIQGAVGGAPVGEPGGGGGGGQAPRTSKLELDTGSLRTSADRASSWRNQA